MKVYIVGVIVEVYSYYDCIDRWDDKPHILGIFTDENAAKALAEEFDGTCIEVELDTVLNDCRETTCNGDCGWSTSIQDCENCKMAYDVLNASGIDITEGL